MSPHFPAPGLARATRTAVTLGCALTALRCAPPESDVDSPFGFPPPGLTPVRFAPEVLSAERHPHGSLAFSPDGREIFWAAFLDEGPEQTLFVSVFDGDSLSAPRVAPFAPDYAGGPSLSSNGERIFFNSRVLQPGREHDLYGIWFAERFGRGWTVPERIAATFDSTRTSGQTSVARNGNLYFAARIWSEPIPKLYRSIYSNGEYAAAVQLEGPVNAYGAVDPYVDPDERFLLFAGIDRPDARGREDIYISRRRDDGSWGEPVNLGLAGNVESDYFDRFPSMSPDGRFLFFVRAVGETFPSYDTHFYWVSAEILGNL